MSNASQPISVTPGAGSGTTGAKYYSTLRLFKYESPEPFDNAIETPWYTINLPLPIHLYDNSHTNFAAQDMGAVGDILNAFSSPIGTLASEAYRAVTVAPEMLASAGTAGSMLSKVIPIPPSISKFIGALNSIPGGRQVPAQLTTAIEQGFGMVSNPNPTIKFTGPALRDFAFTWYFNPKNQQESMNVKKIIQTIKKASLPTYFNGNVSGIMNYPNFCQFNCYPWDQPVSESGHSPNRWGWTENSIIRMKRCFIQSVNVNYNPANVPAFYKDTSPVVYELSLQMKEIEYVTGETWGTESQMDDIAPLLGDFSDPIGNSILNTFDDTRNAST